MIARAPHLDAAGQHLPTYLADRLQVWELITDICREDDCWSFVKPAQQLRDGRKAYWCLYDHYLGPNNAGNMASWAEREVSDAHYQGEKKRWNFEKYMRTHIDQIYTLSGLTEHGYAGIDERSKVRLFIEGIRTKELDPVKTQIMATAALWSDFLGFLLRCWLRPRDLCLSLCCGFSEHVLSIPWITTGALVSTSLAVRSIHSLCGWCVGPILRRYASAAVRDWSEPAPATSNSAPELTGFCVGGCVVHCFFDNGAITAQSGMGTVVGGCVRCPAGMLLETEGMTKCLSGGSCS
jgi:hypothetical protein